MSRVLSVARVAARPVARQLNVRFFGAGVLDANEVSERIQNVVKNFEKVNPASVTATAHFTNDLGAHGCFRGGACLSSVLASQIQFPCG